MDRTPKRKGNVKRKIDDILLKNNEQSNKEDKYSCLDEENSEDYAFRRTPIRSNYQTVEDNSPGIHDNFFDNVNSSPLCVTWDVVRPEAPAEVREAADRLTRELKHHLKVRKKSSSNSPKYYRPITRYHFTKTASPPIERYKQSVSSWKAKLEECLKLLDDKSPNLCAEKEKDNWSPKKEKSPQEDCSVEEKHATAETCTSQEDLFDDSFDDVLSTYTLKLENEIIASQPSLKDKDISVTPSSDEGINSWNSTKRVKTDVKGESLGECTNFKSLKSSNSSCLNSSSSGSFSSNNGSTGEVTEAEYKSYLDDDCDDFFNDLNF